MFFKKDENSVGSDPAKMDITSGFESDKVFIACQDKKVLGAYASKEEAMKRIEEEKERDKLELLLKRSLLKKLLKSGKSLTTNYYYVAEVCKE